MTLAERIMILKEDYFYTELEKRCGVKASIISEIARGIRTEVKGDNKKDIDLGDLMAIAHGAFDITIMALMGPTYGFKRETTFHTTTMIEGVKHIVLIVRVE